MPGFRSALIKVRVYDDQGDDWRKFLRGEGEYRLRPTGYRDGTEGEFVLEQVPELRCTCPVGFGQVKDPNCPRCGRRDPEHTITGAQDVQA